MDDEQFDVEAVLADIDEAAAAARARSTLAMADSEVNSIARANPARLDDAVTKSALTAMHSAARHLVVARQPPPTPVEPERPPGLLRWLWRAIW